MTHLDVVVGTATKTGACERCGKPIEPGQKVAHYPKPPKGTCHLGCHFARRRGNK